MTNKFDKARAYTLLNDLISTFDEAAAKTRSRQSLYDKYFGLDKVNDQVDEYNSYSRMANDAKEAIANDDTNAAKLKLVYLKLHFHEAGDTTIKTPVSVFDLSKSVSQERRVKNYRTFKKATKKVISLIGEGK